MIITEQHLKHKLDQADLVVIHVGNKKYDTTSHIPGAVYLDIKNDLTGENTFIPDKEKLVTKLGSLGIPEDMKVVLYDQGENRHVSKAYLVFNYLGHAEDVFILQGGLSAWEEAGNSVSTKWSPRNKTTYTPTFKDELILDMNDIKARMDDNASVLIDSRAYKRYRGQEEPKYEKAGHIPGAQNFFSKDVFQENQQWKDRRELQEHFSEVNDSEEVIVSCGSGNSACMNFVALKAAGHNNVKIYPGGFSEWISDSKNEVATKEE